MISKVHGLVQVLKFLMEKNSINALHGQVTIGTLILQVGFFSPIFQISLRFVEFHNHFLALKLSMLTFLPPLTTLDFFSSQDCAVGLLFALLPVLCGTSGALQGLMSMTKV